MTVPEIVAIEYEGIVVMSYIIEEEGLSFLMRSMENFLYRSEEPIFPINSLFLYDEMLAGIITDR
jgi:hypothetical protein